jgi:hypothetical protein
MLYGALGGNALLGRDIMCVGPLAAVNAAEHNSGAGGIAWTRPQKLQCALAVGTMADLGLDPRHAIDGLCGSPYRRTPWTLVFLPVILPDSRRAIRYTSKLRTLMAGSADQTWMPDRDGRSSKMLSAPYCALGA